MRGKDYGLSENDHIFSDLNNTDRSALRQKHLPSIPSVNDRIYAHLPDDAANILLFIQRRYRDTSNLNRSQRENNSAFLDGAKEEKQNQIKEQITTLFSHYDLKVLEVDPKVNEKGTIEKIDIKTDKLRHTKKLKTAISNFYNMKESNINISE